MSDLRSLPDSTLKLYLYSLGGWGLLLVPLYLFDRVGVALSLCYPLAVWLGGISVYWWIRMRRQVKAGDLRPDESASGTYSVGKILAGGGVVPGIIFIGQEPLLPSSWGTFAGIAAISALAWVVVALAARFERPVALHAGALLVAWWILPINATGAISLAAIWGWFSTVAAQTPLPGM